MFAFVLTVAIPVVANVLFRKKLHAFLVSTPLGVFVLWANMVSLEVAAADSDLDAIFALACTFWAGVLVCVYAVVFALFALAASRDRQAGKAGLGGCAKKESGTERGRE